MKTIFELKNSVAAILSGVDIQNIDNVFGAFERAARVFVQKAKIPETQGTQNIMLYSGVTDYLIDPRIFGTEIMDIRPQGQTRFLNDFVFKKFSDDFDRQKGYLRAGTMATFAYQNGTPIVRIATTRPLPKIVIDQMNDVTGWLGGGGVSNPVLDTAVYWQQPGSLRFNLPIPGLNTQNLSKTLANSIDASSYQNIGVGFLAVRIPSPVSNLTSITLRLGSNLLNTATVLGQTVSNLGTFTPDNWILVPFDFSTAINTGTPDWTKIQFVQVLFNASGTFTNFRLGGLWLTQPNPNQILYNSAGFFLQNGVVSTSITTDNDQIILNDSAYAIYEYECAISILQQTGGGLSDSTMGYLNSILNGARTRTGAIINLGLYDIFRGQNPSEVLRQSSNWYDDNSYGGYNGY